MRSLTSQFEGKSLQNILHFSCSLVVCRILHIPVDNQSEINEITISFTATVKFKISWVFFVQIHLSVPGNERARICITHCTDEVNNRVITVPRVFSVLIKAELNK